MSTKKSCTIPFKIPKRFMLGGTVYDVVIKSIPEDVSANAELGCYDFLTNTIELYRYNNISKQCLEQSFLHELTHAIFCHINDKESYDNETKVDMFSHHLYEFLKTMEV